MCHQINLLKQAVDAKVFLRSENIIQLVGIKEICFFDGQLYPVTHNTITPYRMKWITDRVVEIVDVISMQSVLFTIPIVDGDGVGWIYRKGEVLAGMHITGFNQEEYKRPNLFACCGCRGTVPVLFLIDDVCFYDGDSVSVNRFRIDFDYGHGFEEQLDYIYNGLKGEVA